MAPDEGLTGQKMNYVFKRMTNSRLSVRGRQKGRSERGCEAKRKASVELFGKTHLGHTEKQEEGSGVLMELDDLNELHAMRMEFHVRISKRGRRTQGR